MYILYNDALNQICCYMSSLGIAHACLAQAPASLFRYDLLHDIELIHLRFSREDGLSIRYLPHDAADRPHVYTIRVVGAP